MLFRSFLVAALGIATLFYGFHAISLLPTLPAGLDYWIEWAGIDFHYRSVSRGLLLSTDLFYVVSVCFLFFVLTIRNLRSHK